MLTLLTLIKRYWISITLFILTVITFLSLYPRDKLPPAPGSDKTHHLVAYALLMFPAAVKKPNYLPAIGLFFVCWSGAIELLQPFVNRYGEFKDLAANIAGLVIGFVIVKILERLLQLNSNKNQ
ncbi:VanZ family protein [Myxosarcina sp. GI1]|uniref:VanZ family protein n=1 Tax=Myxosarcina sp. GI1 TaxID=1541065 RepID=UPI00055F5D92|nr:VanZ family protein [Myxosarcina sp. GI1]